MILARFILCCCIAAFAGSLSFPVFASNILTNPSFEDGASNWSLFPSTATMSATEEFKHNGAKGIQITKSSSSWAYISQKVPIEANVYYKLSGWALMNDDYINNIKLRFYWLDGGSQKSEVIDNETKVKSGDFQFIETDGMLSPDWAQFADIQAYVYLDKANPVEPAIFDDLLFERYIPPTSTPTPTNTPIPTSTVTPTEKPTGTPTSSKTPTRTPSIKQNSPTGKSNITTMPLLSVSQEKNASVLGVMANGGITSTPSSSIVSSSSDYSLQTIWAFVATAVGCIIIAGSLVTLQLKKPRQES